jgi:hypothetical protein
MLDLTQRTANQNHSEVSTTTSPLRWLKSNQAMISGSKDMEKSESSLFLRDF